MANPVPVGRRACPTRIHGRVLFHTQCTLYLFLIFLLTPITSTVQPLSLYSDLISLDYRPPASIQALSLYSDLLALDYRFTVPIQGKSLFSDLIALDYRPLAQPQGLSLFSDLIPLNYQAPQAIAGLSLYSDLIALDYEPPEVIGVTPGEGGLGDGGPGDGGYVPPQPENTYALRGRVSGAQDLSNIRMRLSGADSKTARLASNGQFSFLRLTAGDYSLTPVSSLYDFSPASRNLTLNSDSSNQDFTASEKPPDTTNSFTIAGVQVRGAGITVNGDFREGSGDFSIGDGLKFNGILKADLSAMTLTLTGDLTLTVSNKKIFNFTLKNRSLDFSTLKLRFDQGEGEGRRIKFLGLTFEVSEIGFSLQNGRFESFLFRGAMIFSRNLLKRVSGGTEVRFDFQSQNRYILYRPGGDPKWEIVGTVAFNSTHGLGVKGVATLDSGAFEFDTVQDKYKISASLSIGHFFGGIDGSVGFRRGRLDSFGIGVSDLNKPLGTTGLFFQSIYGEVENICYFTKTCSDPAILALRNVQITGGPKFKIPFTNIKAHLIQLTMSGQYSFAGELSGTADLSLLTDDLKMAGAAFSLKKGFLYLEGTLTLADFLNARGALRYDKKAKDPARRLEAGFDGSLTIQRKWPIVGPIAGGSKLNARVYLNKQYLAAGVEVSKCKWSICLGVGASVSHKHGDSYGPTSWKVVWGMDKVLEVNASPAMYRLISQSVGGAYMGIFSASQIARNFFVDSSGEQVMIRLLYTGSLPAQITLSAPDGAQITRDDEAHKVLFFPGEENSEYLIYLLEPISGNWSLSFDDSSLLEYTLEIYGPNPAPEVSILSPQDPLTLQGGVNSLPVTVSLSDSDPLTLSFYFDEDMDGEDGLFIQELSGIDGSGQDFTTNLSIPSDLPSGDYFLYLRVDDGKNFPVIDYTSARITWVSTSTLASVQNLVIMTHLEGLQVSFSAVPSTTAVTLIAYEILYHDGTTENSTSIPAEENTILLTPLSAGRTYTVQVIAIAEDGSRSLASEPVSELYAPQDVNQPPLIEAPNFPAPAVGENFSGVLQASDPENQSLIYVLLSFPQGMSIDEQSGLLSWTPTEAEVGLHLISVEVKDLEGASSVLDFEILVYSSFVINRPPSIGQDQITTSMILGQSLSLSLPVTDPEGTELLITLNGVPSGLQADLQADLQVEGKILSFNPSTAGHFDVEVEVSDGELSDSLLISIDVIPESPSCSLLLPGSNAKLMEELSFSVTGQGGTEPYLYRFDFSGTGVFDTRLNSMFSSLSTTSHHFQTDINPGLIEVQAEVRDSEGLLGRCAGTLLLADSAGNYAPVIFASLNPGVVKPSQPSLVSLSGTYDDRDLAEDLQIAWDYAGNPKQGFSFNDLSREISFSESGVYSVTVQVMDSDTMVSEKELSLRVEEISRGDTEPRTADLGLSYLHQISPHGGNSPYGFAVVEGVLPGGLNLSPALGSISGIPEQSGVFDFSLEVSDSTSPALIQTFPMQIEVRGVAETPSQSFSLPLSAGWNLISIPVQTSLTSVEELLGTNQGRLKVAWKLNSGVWSLHLPLGTPESQRKFFSSPSFTGLEGGEGLFLKISEGEAFSIELSGPQRSLDQLSAGSGFSLMGVGESIDAGLFLEEHSRTTLFAYQGGLWLVRQGELSLSDLKSLYGENIQRLESLEPGIGYFIK
jgi:hypothetical protein